jgi:hypothetical protein
MVIGALLSMRDAESLCEQAGLGKLSKSTAARICSELRERFAAFQRRDVSVGRACNSTPVARFRPTVAGATDFEPSTRQPRLEARARRPAGGSSAHKPEPCIGIWDGGGAVPRPGSR